MAYDGIVIRSNSAGSPRPLNQAGKQMVVFERLEPPGSDAHAFRRGAYLFDGAVHATD